MNRLFNVAKALSKFREFIIGCIIVLALGPALAAQNPMMRSNAANDNGGPATTVTMGTFGSGAGASPNIPLSWFGGSPTAGNGVVVFFWHGTSTTVASVCNAASGGANCAGSDTFTSLGSYTNPGHFISEVYVNCDVTQANAPTVTLSSAAQVYAVAFYFSGQTTTGGATGCIDTGGLSNAQSTSVTQLTGGAIVTTNAADLLVILASNDCGGAPAYAAGVDGKGNAMTDSGISMSGVLGIGYRTESATNTYTPTVTGGPTCGGGGNAQTLALK